MSGELPAWFPLVQNAVIYGIVACIAVIGWRCATASDDD